MIALRSLISEGTPVSITDWPAGLREFHLRQEDISVVGSVVLINERVVVPRTLRKETIRILHSGHCGVTGMSDRAREVMFWPGMIQEIKDRRTRCQTCTRTAPSQAAAPPTVMKMAEYLFQHVVSDYLQLSGHLYFIFCCHYSGWLSVF
jgi:hypothetical protein